MDRATWWPTPADDGLCPLEHLDEALTGRGVDAGRRGRGDGLVALPPEVLDDLGPDEPCASDDDDFHGDLRKNSDNLYPRCAMIRADHAWREALRATTIADLVTDVRRDSGPEALPASASGSPGPRPSSRSRRSVTPGAR